MLARTSWIRLFAFLLTILFSSFGPGPSIAWAQDDDEEKEKKGGDEEEEEEEEEGDDAGDEEEDTGKLDKDQPKVTAGGNFTMASYPVEEVERPLSLSKGILEGRVGVTIDLSKGTVFKSAFLDVQARYGVIDTLELQLGTYLGLAAPEGIEKPKLIYGGIEQAIIYNLVDARLRLEVPIDPTTVDIVLGFPFKYRFNDKIAIVALDRLLAIHTKGGRSPDLEVGVGGVFQAIPMLAIVVRATLILPEFDPDLIRIPLQVDVQLSPSNHVDFGLSAVLANVKGVEDGPGPIDQRAFQLFVRARI
jgi:hypothetical protein